MEYRIWASGGPNSTYILRTPDYRCYQRMVTCPSVWGTPETPEKCQPHDYTSLLLTILIPVTIILLLFLAFLVVLLINPRLALWIKPHHLKPRKGILGLMRNRRIRGTRAAVNNNYTVEAETNASGRPAVTSIPIRMSNSRIVSGRMDSGLSGRIVTIAGAGETLHSYGPPTPTPTPHPDVRYSEPPVVGPVVRS